MYDSSVVGKLKLGGTLGLVGTLRLVGLTGGIGSGKSTVAQMIRAEGIPVLDADVIARAIVAPGQPAHAEIRAAWPDVVDAGGGIDRKKLGARIFADAEARSRLDTITHPRIQEQAAIEARRLEANGHHLAFYEAALLVESGRHRDFDGLVVVTANEEQQLARVQRRDGVTREDAQARLGAQLALEHKRKAATHVIDNSGDLDNTRRQVEALLAELGRVEGRP